MDDASAQCIISMRNAHDDDTLTNHIYGLFIKVNLVIDLFRL